MKKQSFVSPNYLPLLRNNLIYGSLAILTLFVFIVAGTMLINGCNKDGEITDPELSYRNSSNTSTSAILSKINFDQDGNILLGSGTSQVTLQHASIEYQREVSDYIFDNLSFSRIDSMREMYGHPVWELATIDTNTGNSINYLVSVPMVKENVITSYLLFQKFNDLSNCRLITGEMIKQVLNNTTENNEYYKNWITPVAKFEIFKYLINSNPDINFANWISYAKNMIDTSNNNLILRDAEELCIDILSQLIIDGDGPHYNCYKLCIESGGGIPDFNGYFGDDGFGNDWNDGDDFGNGSNAGGNGTYGDSGDNAPKVDKAKKLKCAVEVADFMAQAEVLKLIANNNLTDPCDPTKRAAELLEKALNGYCYAKIGDEPLNLKDAEHFMGEILEGGDYIIEDQSFINCKNVHCILQKLIKNPLNSNSYNSICALDNSKNYMFNFTMGNANKTTFDPNNPNNITITIDNKLCNSNDPVNIAETLLHEGTHGIIFGNFANNFDANIFNSQNWNNVINNTYGGNVHEFMTDYLLNIVCGALWEFNGKRGTPNDYWGVVLNGLYQNLDNNGNFLIYNSVIYDWLTNPLYSSTINPTGMSVEAWIADMMQRYTNNIQNHPNGFGVKFDCP